MTTDIYIITASTGTNREQRRIPLDNVEAFFSSDKYVLARLNNGAEVFLGALQAPKETARKNSGTVITLREIEGWLARIGQRNFVRVHRGWLANMNHVTTYRAHCDDGGAKRKGGELITSSKRAIPTSRREQAKTKRTFQQGAFA